MEKRRVKAAKFPVKECKGAGDDFRCDCGNDACSDGFVTCMGDTGRAVEPTLGGPWSGHYRCNRCGQVWMLADGTPPDERGPNE